MAADEVLNAARWASAFVAAVAFLVVLYRVHDRSDPAVSFMRTGVLILAFFEVVWGATAALEHPEPVIAAVALVRCIGWLCFLAPLAMGPKGANKL